MLNKIPLDLKTKILILSMALVILALIIVLLIPKKNTPQITNVNPVTEVNQKTSSTNEITIAPIKVDKFRTEVPTNIVVPSKTTKLTEAEKKEIAIPIVVMPAAPGTESSFRSFDIKAEAGIFTPNKIIVKLGDTVHINFTAIDKDYDIVFPSYGMKQSAKKGQTKILEFQASNEGSFLYYCEICGGEQSTTKGNVIIVK